MSAPLALMLAQSLLARRACSMQSAQDHDAVSDLQELDAVSDMSADKYCKLVLCSSKPCTVRADSAMVTITLAADCSGSTDLTVMDTAQNKYGQDQPLAEHPITIAVMDQEFNDWSGEFRVHGKVDIQNDTIFWHQYGLMVAKVEGDDRGKCGILFWKSPANHNYGKGGFTLLRSIWRRTRAFWTSSLCKSVKFEHDHDTSFVERKYWIWDYEQKMTCAAVSGQSGCNGSLKEELWPAKDKDDGGETAWRNIMVHIGPEAKDHHHDMRAK